MSDKINYQLNTWFGYKSKQIIISNSIPISNSTLCDFLINLMKQVNYDYFEFKSGIEMLVENNKQLITQYSQIGDEFIFKQGTMFNISTLHKHFDDLIDRTTISYIMNMLFD